MNAQDAATQLLERVRGGPWGLATVAIVGDQTAVAVDAGDDLIDEASLFPYGSIAKTMTGVLFADAIVRGEAAAETTVGELLGVRGPASKITLEALATQRSGLPRLPPNLDPTQVDRRDPYAAFLRDDLLAALEAVEPGDPSYEYSNFGFMTLGQCLAAVGGASIDELFRKRLFAPLGMSSAGCPPTTDGCLPGYVGGEQVRWWHNPLPGSGGVGGSIRDLASYLRAHIDVPAGTLGDAIRAATTSHAGPPNEIGYGWMARDGGWWHNGAAGGFCAFVGFNRPARVGVAMLANTSPPDGWDATGLGALRDLCAAHPQPEAQ